MATTYSLGPVMLDVAGCELDVVERDLMAHPQVGGVILFSRNYESPHQLLGLTRQIREIRSQLLIAVDHEGGRVQRFRHGFTPIPSMMSLATHEPSLLKATAQLMALELMATGIDFTFAPVLDRFNPSSQVIGDRAFSEDLSRIASLAGEFIAGLTEEGMAAVGKHFPGHGGVSEDTHIEAAVDNREWTEIESADLRPFSLLASTLAGIMPAHVCFPSVCNKPVGFSSYWLREILRESLDFAGVVFSDDLSMAAAKAYGSPLSRGQAALQAGCDIVLLCNAPSDAIMLIEGLERENGPAVYDKSLSKRLLMLSAHKKRAQLGFDWRALRSSSFWQSTHQNISRFSDSYSL